LQCDPDFQKEFDNTVSDPKLPEANDDFAFDVCDDTHLNVELATPRDRDGPKFA
jgi:hypothetical protein